MSVIVQRAKRLSGQSSQYASGGNKYKNPLTCWHSIALKCPRSMDCGHSDFMIFSKVNGF